MARKIVYYMAISMDGFIAHRDGSVGGFGADPDVVRDYLDSLKHFDTVLMGRKTYEFGFQFGVTDPYPFLKSYVFSRTMESSPHPHVVLVREDAVEFIRALKDREGGSIYFCGAADLAAQVFAAGLIDEIILKVNPFVMGGGIPLFAAPTPMTQFDLVSCKTYRAGVVFLHYRVKCDG